MIFMVTWINSYTHPLFSVDRHVIFCEEMSKSSKDRPLNYKSLIPRNCIEVFSKQLVIMVCLHKRNKTAMTECYLYLKFRLKLDKIGKCRNYNHKTQFMMFSFLVFYLQSKNDHLILSNARKSTKTNKMYLKIQEKRFIENTHKNV